MAKSKKTVPNEPPVKPFSAGPVYFGKPKEEPPVKPFSAGPAYFGKKIIPKLIPLLVVGAIVATMLGLDYTGYIDIENTFDFPLEIKDHAIMNKPYAFDFAPKLIPMLNPAWNGERNGYTFYLDSVTGFPPMGLILGANGILSGITKGRSSTFIVCVKNIAGESKCAKVHLTVDEEEENKDVSPIYNCPLTSHDISTPCGSIQTGGAGVSGIYVRVDCTCPSDTIDSETIVQSEGESYRTCICK
jgi:hypothetical protein